MRNVKKLFPTVLYEKCDSKFFFPILIIFIVARVKKENFLRVKKIQDKKIEFLDNCILLIIISIITTRSLSSVYGIRGG